MTSSIELMRQSIEAHNLLRHPFYQAWSAGTLPVAALQSYATEYGAFIRTLGDGWARVGEPEGAAIEQQHAELWDGFAAALGVKVTGAPAIAETAELLACARTLFADEATAIGALYAFERQQPETAESKLKGLQTHYSALPEGVAPYFEAHAHETGEDVMLEQKLMALPKADRVRALDACEQMSKALWNALSGLTPAELRESCTLH